MDNLYFILQQMIYFTIPLLIVALGGMFSERSGVVNIALEGIMLFGAFFGVLTINILQRNFPTESILWSQGYLLIGMLIASITGILFSLFHAYASIHMKSNQVISGTALNLFAPAFAIYLARMMAITNYTQQVPFRSRFFLIRDVTFLHRIPVIGDIFFRQAYLTTYIGILILIIAATVLYKTKLGLRIRACGEHPQAADAVGVGVYKIRYIGVATSGMLAGIGGLVFIITTSTNFNATVAGYGFLALAVLIFGQWRPWRILFAALFFGFMMTISAAYTGIPFLQGLNIPSDFYKMIPYIATLVLLSFTSLSARAPKSLGEVYDAGKR